VKTSLILIPGLASNSAMWSAQVAGLGLWRPVVSDVNARAESIPAMASLLLEEHAGPLVLCGASMGGMIAMEAARQAPERVAGLALLGTDARHDSAAMTAIRLDAMKLFAQGKVREVIEPNVAFAFHPDNAPRLAGIYLDFILAAGAEQLIRQNRAVISRPDARKHLPQVKCPVLVMCGDSDRLTALERSEEIVSLVPHAKFVVVPRCGHMLTMERPEVVNRELDRWLEGVMDPGSSPG
jgi:pimeloyl-ACP methyl ester carboxylesterase